MCNIRIIMGTIRKTLCTHMCPYRTTIYVIGFVLALFGTLRAMISGQRIPVDVDSAKTVTKEE